MSKERLRTYAEGILSIYITFIKFICVTDDDMSHSSDSFEPDTPTDVSDSDMEIVDDDELVDKLFEEKAKAVEQENELREKLARKMAEKALKRKMAEKNLITTINIDQQVKSEEQQQNDVRQENGDIEDGEIVSDEDEHKLSKIPLPPPSPKLIDVSDDEETNMDSRIPHPLVLPAPPPPPPPPNSSVILEYDIQSIVTTPHSNESVVQLVSSTATTANIPVTHDSSNGAIPLSLHVQLSELEKKLLQPMEPLEDELDYDEMGSEPEIDLF